MSTVLLILTTIDSQKKARTLADLLLRNRLAACVTSLATGDSRYWWKGRIDRSREFLLLIKTSAHKRRALTQFLKRHHPYEVPELLALRASWADPAYVEWLQRALHEGNPSGKKDSRWDR